MVQHCCVKGCGSKFSVEANKVAFFNFPHDPNTKETWFTALRELNCQPTLNLNKYSRVCDKHFESDQIFHNGRRAVLFKTSVPTVFPSCEYSNVEFLLTPDEESINLNTTNNNGTNQEILFESVNGGKVSGKSAGHFFVCCNCGHNNSVIMKSGRESNVDATIQSDANSHKNQRKRRNFDNIGSILEPTKKFITFCEYNAYEPNMKVPTSTHTLANSFETLQTNPEENTTPKTRRNRRVFFAGDVNDDADLTPKSSKKFIASLRKTVVSQRKKLRFSAQKFRRQNIQIQSLKSVLQDLKKKNMISENALELLKCSDESIMRTIEKGKVNNQYVPEVRSFALTLHFYSPRAYRYVRSRFRNKLPAPRTLRKWCESVNGDPGITKEALDVLSVKIKDFKAKGKELRFSMVVDDMSIRKQIEFNFAKKKYFGYVDFGGADTDKKNNVAATKAWVVLLTALNANFKIPIAYFLTNGLTAKEQAGIVNKVLRVLHENDVVVVSLVFDGTTTNVSMANALNRKMSKPTFFHHPVTGAIIHIIWDACHMIKLVRNTLASKKVLHDAQGRRIEWKYIEMLHNIQEQHRIRLGNRLTQQHVQFSGKKMNVRLATQTLSKSVADALEVLKEKHPDFKYCTGTIEFIRIFDKLFDVCNSKSKFGMSNIPNITI